MFFFSPQCLPYSLLLQQLELKNVRELEDLLIEAVYCDIIQGKLDQRNQQVEVDCSVGRDLGPNELPNIINTLQEWSVCPLCVCAHTLDLCLNYLFPQFTIYLPPCLSFLSLRCTGCEAVLCGIEEQVSRANQYRESQLKVKVQVETEVSASSLQPVSPSFTHLVFTSLCFCSSSNLWHFSSILTTYIYFSSLSLSKNLYEHRNRFSLL